MNSLICRVLIGVFLFAQLSVSAYACPGLSRASMPVAQVPMPVAQVPMPVAQVRAGEAEAMPADCAQMARLDPQSANLCAEHCKFGHQSADGTPVPVVIATAPVMLYVLPEDGDQAGRVGPRARDGDPLLAAPPPDHAILHCVLRI